ncbi:MAG TPA: hypothetical protein VGF73_09060 [Chthoniobacterales bacterium]
MITLIMISLCAVIAVALMTNASLDRTTSRSVGDRYQAELAVQNGLEAVKHALSTDGTGGSITSDDTFTVVRVSDPASTATNEDDKPHYYFIGQLKGLSGSIKYFPLYSGGPAPTSVLPTTLPAYSLTDPTKTASNLPALLTDPANSSSFLPPAVTTQWIELNDPNVTPPAPLLRYCYWVEDLDGYVDADTAGNTFGVSATGDPIHTRDLTILQPLIDTGKTAPTSAVALWTLFNPPALDPGASPQQADNQTFVSNRPLIFTSNSVGQILGNPSTSFRSTIARHVIATTEGDQEQEVIPFGLGYINQGSPKTDLNARIAAKDVTGIADTIKGNLTNWASSRRGGFGGVAASAAADDSYRHTIAANIIAYAQPLADAPPAGSDYRAVGPYPLVNEFYDYVNWTTSSSDSVTFEVTSYIELWNMSNQTITGTVRFTDYYRHQTTIGVFAYFGDNHDPSAPDPGETVSGFPTATQSVSLDPNEFHVLKFGPVTYTLSAGAIPPDQVTLFETRTGRYKLEWQSSGASSFVDIDEPGGAQPNGGLEMQDDTLYNPPPSGKKQYAWNGSLPGFNYYKGTTTFYDNPGDPRSSIYNMAPQAANDYNKNATMWSHNAKPTSGVVIRQEVKTTRWPDLDHDTALISPVGLADTIPPPTTRPANAPAIESTKAPMVIAAAGKLNSLAELSNIYDPAQWNISTTGDKWTDIDSSTVADQHYGGGFSLRIGRPEFTRFDVDGLRASQLLDLFSLGPSHQTEGLVNLNTATRETLRALGAGLILGQDPDIQPSALKNSLYPPYVTNQADKFADAVIFARSTKPFLSISQLAQLRDAAGNQFFGNPAQWAFPQTAPTEWNDAGTEEYFGRIFDLSSVRSRNFRVFVTGQYVDPRPPFSTANPKVLSTIKRVYHVFLHPTRAADSSITSQKVDVTYEQNL